MRREVAEGLIFQSQVALQELAKKTQVSPRCPHEAEEVPPYSLENKAAPSSLFSKADFPQRGSKETPLVGFVFVVVTRGTGPECEKKTILAKTFDTNRGSKCENIDFS